MRKNARNGFYRSFFAALASITATFFLLNTAALHAQPETQENLGANVNTEHAELVPIVSPDGKTLYFDRKNAPGNVGGASDPDDIYYSTLNADGSWGLAVNIGSPLNTSGSDVLFWLSPDGNTALVYHGKLVNGSEVGLAISRKRSGKWTEPQKVTIEGLESLGDYYYAHMSADGKRLFLSFATDPKRDNYDFDIYYSAALSDDLMRWGTPIRLPEYLNTPFSEGAPFIAADNRTLYFISDRPENYGLSDIYVARRTGDSWIKWTPPQNLGEFINTPLYEAGVSIPASGDWLYTSRSEYKSQGGYGRTDLYRQKLPEDLRPQVGFLLTGQLIDKGTKNGISGLVRITDLHGGREIAVTASGQDGAFTAVLIPGMMYKIEGTAAGYNSSAQTLDVRTEAPKSIESMTILLESTGPVEIPTILFASGSAQISNDGKAKLRRMNKALAPSLTTGKIGAIEIIGHTDSVGTEEDNQRLSEERAKSVRDMLVQLGFPANLLASSGRGEVAPIASNGALQGRAENRRVELVVVYSTTPEPEPDRPSMIPPRE